MLQDSHVFSSFSVDDLEKAQEFYSKTLGLAVVKEDMGVLKIHLKNGGEVMLYPKGNQHTPATFTVLNFIVTDIEKIVTELTQKGITFEQYDMEYIKTNEKGIANQGDHSMAWFQDPAKNILSIIQEK